MDMCEWEPFLKAAFERNPVSIEYFKDCDLPTAYCQLNEWPNESIYEGNRLALPDEVINYQRGDGIEKAITLVNIARSKHKNISMEQIADKIVVKSTNLRFEFHTSKTISIPTINY
jgi:hypothetical protein